MSEHFGYTVEIEAGGRYVDFQASAYADEVLKWQEAEELGNALLDAAATVKENVDE
jgi:hypothetical protein